MNLEIRADGLHVSGYVNVTEKMSRPLMTGKGQKVIEVIEPRTFEKALERAENVAMTKDHNPDIVLAETRSNDLVLYEDAIGLHAEAVITDESTIEEARAGKIKGWSFGMRNIEDKIEERAEGLPIRHVSGMDLDHITLVVNKAPCYAATSVEMRANDVVDSTEYRAGVEYKNLIVTETTERYFDDGSSESETVRIEKGSRTPFDNSEYKSRIEATKQAG